MDKFIPYEVLLKKSLIENGTITPQDVITLSCVCKGMNTYLKQFKTQCHKNGICEWLRLNPKIDWVICPTWVYNMIASFSNDEPTETMRLLELLPDVYTEPKTIDKGSRTIELFLNIAEKIQQSHNMKHDRWNWRLVTTYIVYYVVDRLLLQYKQSDKINKCVLWSNKRFIVTTLIKQHDLCTKLKVDTYLEDEYSIEFVKFVHDFLRTYRGHVFQILEPRILKNVKKDLRVLMDSWKHNRRWRNVLE